MKFFACLAALVVLTATRAAVPAAWERLAPLPVGNGGFVAAALGEEIVVAGGTTWRGETKLWLDQIWAYHPGRNTWRETGRLPSPLAYPASGHDGRTLWFAGGSSGTATVHSLWKLAAGPTATRVASLDRGFVYAAGDVIGATLYAVGGTDDQAALQRIASTFFAIDLKSGAVRQLADYPEASLTTATAAAVGDRLFVFGGARWDEGRKTVVNHSSAHAYSVTRARWEQLPALPHPGRGYTAVALDHRHLYLAGGYRNDAVEFVADAYLYDTATGQYRPTVPLPYAGMVGLVRSGAWLYCLGGEDRKKHRTDAVYRIRWRELLAPVVTQ